MASAYSIVLIAVSEAEHAEKLATQVLTAQLAACVNIVPGVTSMYWWDGKLQKSPELLLILKTRSELLLEVTDFVRKNHTYSVPEIVSLPIQQGNQAYLDWIGANTRFTSRS